MSMQPPDPHPLRWRRITLGLSLTSIFAAVLANLPGLLGAIHGVWPAFSTEWQDLVRMVALILAAAGSITSATAGLQGAAHVEQRLTGAQTVTAPEAQPGQVASNATTGTIPTVREVPAIDVAPRPGRMP